MPTAGVHAATASNPGVGSGAVPKGRKKAPLKCKFAELTRCTGSHPPWLGKAFGDKTPEERSRIIEDNKLCLLCLLHSAEEVFYSKTYKTKLVCTKPECKEKHVMWLHDVLKGLLCLKKEQQCKVNLVQGGEGWKTPEESWMDIEEAKDEVYFVNVLLGGAENGTDSDEEMEREIVEAEAAMDASIRRWPKRRE
jgi:hypothetical protein